MKLDVLGISECKWTDSRKIMKDDHIIICYGGREHKNGVGIIMRREMARSLIGKCAISEREIMIKLQAKPFNISIIQVYAPTEDHEEIALFCHEVHTAKENVKTDDILCVLGGLNAKVVIKELVTQLVNMGWENEINVETD